MMKFCFAAALTAAISLAQAAPITLNPLPSQTDYRFETLLQSSSVQDILDPTVTLYWGTQPTPVFAEQTRVDVYSGTGISLSPFGGSPRHCLEAFTKALRSMVTDAREHGYDAVVGIRAAVDGQPTADAEGFRCEPGYKVTRVQLLGALAMSAESRSLAAERDRRAATAGDGVPRTDSVVVSLVSILASDEAKAILGRGMTAHPQRDALPYAFRYGPLVYTDDAPLAKSTPEAACSQAVLNGLKSMVDDAADRHYDTVVGLRSFLQNRLRASADEIECRLDKKSASVALQAWLAERL